MNIPRLFLPVLLLLITASFLKAENSTVYELRTYYTHPEKLDDLHARFRDHTMGIFEKHGMTNVGYWVPVENEEQILIYLLSYPSMDARKAAWKGFRDDPDWKAAYAASTENGKLVKKVDSVFFTATDYSPSPQIEVSDPERLFEMRKYTTNEGKLTGLDARFRDHTVGLFEKHGATNVVYLHPMKAEDGAEDTLLYFLTHKDQESRDATFKAFGQDPDWKAARAASEANGRLLIKGGVQATMLMPTDYSPMK